MNFLFVMMLCFIVNGPHVFSHRPMEYLADNASNKCQHGLATYNDVKRGLADMTNLSEGASGWIAGYATLSRVISYDGCFNSKVSVAKKEKQFDDEDILIHCVTFCDDKTFYYVGIKGNTCYCLTANERNTISTDQVKSRDCYTACRITVSFNCTTYVGVYRVRDDIIAVGQGQCVYISKKDKDKISYGTASCHTVTGLVISGFICHNLKTHCLKEEVGTSWTQAQTKCFSNNASLVSTAYSSHYHNFTKCCNKKYWTGGFRTITTVNTTTNSCLAVTQVQSQYMLDTDDCSTSKMPICLKRRVNPDTQPDTTSDIPNPSSSEHNTDDNLALTIGVTLAVITLVAGLICVIVICKKKRDPSNRDKTLINHDHDFTNTGTNIIDNSDQSLEHVGLPETEHNVSHGYEAKCPPIKPERNTLRRKKMSIQCYENFNLIPKDETQTAVPCTASSRSTSVGDQYDRINLTLPNKRRDNKVHGHDDDVHVYNHVVNNDEDYDVTTTQTFPKPKHTDYSSTVIQEEQRDKFNNIAATKSKLQESAGYNEYGYLPTAATTSHIKTLKGSPGDCNDVLNEDDIEYIYIDDDKLTIDKNENRHHDYTELDYDEMNTAELPFIKSPDNEEFTQQSDSEYSVANRGYVNTYIESDQKLS